MTPDDVASAFSRDYLVMAYVASLGAIQIGATVGGLRGLFLIPEARAARALGVLLLVSAFAYFFLAPLWSDGPWGRETAAGGVSGAEGLNVEWSSSSWADLPRARNINDIDGGLSGTTQGLWFPTGAAAALVSTLVLASIVNRRLAGRPAAPLDGIGTLGSASWWRALRPSLRAWLAVWQRELRAQFDDDREWAWLRRFVNRRRAT